MPGLTRPVIHRAFDLAVDPPDRVYLISEWDTLVIENRLACLVAPECDGRSGVEEIARRLEDRISILDVRHGLAMLEKAGYLEEGAGNPPQGPPAGGPPGAAVPVRIDPAGMPDGFDPAPLVAALEWHHLVPAMRDVDAALHVVCVPDYMGEEFTGRADALAGRTWMPVDPTGTLAWIGPLFRPGDPPCPGCVRHRVAANREYFAAAVAGTPAARLVRRAAPLRTGEFACLAAWVAAFAREALEGGEIASTLVTIDAIRGRPRRHRVVARAGCATCRPQEDDSGGARVTLRPGAARDRSGGGHRIEPPEATFDRIAHHVDPITGIVPQLRSVPTGDAVVHVWTTGQNVAWMHPRRRETGRSIRSRCAGKGPEAIHARVGAVCEALERHAGTWQGNEPIHRAPYAALGDDAVDPRRLLHFSEAQYRDRDRWNAVAAGHNWIPKPFAPDRSVCWTPAWSLTEDAPRLLPTGWCWYGYPGCEPFFRPDSNGCAAGNTIEEAILQGFLELVERDSVAIWWYHRLRRPGVNLDSLDRAWVGPLRARYEALGRAIHVLDLTADLGIHAFAAVSTRRDGPARGGVIAGFGAHLDPAVAVTRALTEMNQFLPAALSDDGRGTVEGVFDSRITSLDYMMPAADAPSVDLTALPDRSHADLGDDVRHCASIAARHGLETLVLDQTRPWIGLHVVRVVVPGLRPFWARFGPGRLWEVPRAMGWEGRGADESALNPLHLAI